MVDAPRPSEVSLLLADVARGDSEARERLVMATYSELKRLAASQLGDRRASIQPTALTHEAFERMFRGTVVKPEDRRQFFGLAAKVMRDLVVDHARAAATSKRGGRAERVTLTGLQDEASDVDVLDLHDALEELGRRDPGQRELVELRFFAGLQMTQIAEAMDVSVSTVEREWRAARAWLASRLA